MPVANKIAALHPDERPKTPELTATYCSYMDSRKLYLRFSQRFLILFTMYEEILLFNKQARAERYSFFMNSNINSTFY